MRSPKPLLFVDHHQCYFVAHRRSAAEMRFRQPHYHRNQQCLPGRRVLGCCLASSCFTPCLKLRSSTAASLTMTTRPTLPVKTEHEDRSTTMKAWLTSRRQLFWTDAHSNVAQTRDECGAQVDRDEETVATLGIAYWIVAERLTAVVAGPESTILDTAAQATSAAVASAGASSRSNPATPAFRKQGRRKHTATQSRRTNQLCESRRALGADTLHRMRTQHLATVVQHRIGRRRAALYDENTGRTTDAKDAWHECGCECLKMRHPARRRLGCQGSR